jgi:hypothetical protein
VHIVINKLRAFYVSIAIVPKKIGMDDYPIFFDDGSDRECGVVPIVQKLNMKALVIKFHGKTK